MNKLLHLSASALLLCLFFSSCHTQKRHATTGISVNLHFSSDRSRKNTTDGGLFRKSSNKNEDPYDEGYQPEEYKSVYVSFKNTPYTDRPEPEDIPTASKGASKDDNRTIPKSLKKKYANMLGVSYKEIHNYKLFGFIDIWYGTSYRLGGNDKSGIDCSAFAKRLFSDVYGTDLQRTAMEQFTSCKRIKNRKYAHEGDLVFFRVHSKRITHVGVYLTNDFFVHASTSQGVVISNLNDDYWHKYYVGMGRIPR